jgi:hypothetical protein
MADIESVEVARPARYGWYSEAQEVLLKTLKVSVAAGARGVPIYTDSSGEKVRTTMVSDTPHHGTTFGDIVCVGEVKEFAGFGEFREDI